MSNGKKRPILVVLIVLCLIFLVLWFTPPLGSIGARTERSFRCFKLQEWREEVLKYIQENEILPKSLYDVAVMNDEIFHYLQVSVPETIEFSKIRDQLFDQECFDTVVEYQIAISKNEWYVFEIKPGKRYKKRLLIDSKGNIYSLKLMNQ